jgi:acyl-coenzyme A thioesterase PaaI-like protein
VLTFDAKHLVSTRAILMTALDTEIPEGFEQQTRRSPLTDPWEPIYSKQTPDALILGLRLAKPHTNARGFAHGGLIAALTDKAMGHSCGRKLAGAYSLVTVSMAIDFISSSLSDLITHCRDIG